MKPRLLDLFCGAGGAAMGYHRAGFEVVGVDKNRQPHYPFEFHQADALAFPLDGFDAIHASPPCQAYSTMNNIHSRADEHPDLVAPVRAMLVAHGSPYVIENVAGAPLRAQLLLCGTMFGLRIIKHRYFESSGWLSYWPPATCNHADVYDPWHGSARTTKEYQDAQGTPWIPAGGGASRKGGRTGDVSNAIPPAYTEFIGKQLMSALKN